MMFTFITLDAFTPRGMIRTAFEVMQQSAKALSLIAPGRESRAALQEFKNKLEVFNLFENVDSALKIPQGTCLQLSELTARASALGSYRSVWATEGLGHYCAEVAWQDESPRNLLKGENVRIMSASSFIALHAGMGLSFANRLLESQSPASEVRSAIQKFAALCEDNSSEGYFGAAYESLGLVARNLYPDMVGVIDRHLSDINPHLLGYFWHGVGRALYFAPTNYLPLSSSFSRALEMALREPPHELGRLNALAGLAWALTMVNIRQPEILETALKQNADRLPESDAFSNGVSSSMIIWRASTYDDLYISQLREYHPHQTDLKLVELWNSQVQRPCEVALQDYYDALKEHISFGEVFRYQSLQDLVARLQTADSIYASSSPA